MVLVQVDLTKKANKNLKIFMAVHNQIDKRISINKILEKLDPK